jgi:hypothetical protein
MISDMIDPFVQMAFPDWNSRLLEGRVIALVERDDPVNGHVNLGLIGKRARASKLA